MRKQNSTTKRKKGYTPQTEKKLTTDNHGTQSRAEAANATNNTTAIEVHNGTDRRGAEKYA